MPLAYSALALAALYAMLAAWQMPRRRVLGESFAVLATGFATLAVPLALSARSTACEAPVSLTLSTKRSPGAA